jgi:hypothetical protein
LELMKEKVPGMS